MTWKREAAVAAIKAFVEAFATEAGRIIAVRLIEKPETDEEEKDESD